MHAHGAGRQQVGSSTLHAPAILDSTLSTAPLQPLHAISTFSTTCYSNYSGNMSVLNVEERVVE